MQPKAAESDASAPLVPSAEGGPAAASTFVGPRNPLEQLIADIWCEALVVDQVGIRDDFFAIGGESLEAAQVLMNLHDQLGIELQVRELFENATVERMAVIVAAALEAKQQRGGSVEQR